MYPSLTLKPDPPTVYGLQSSNRVRSSLTFPLISFSTESQLVSVIFRVIDWVPLSVAPITLAMSKVTFSSPSVGSFSARNLAVIFIVPVVLPGKINIVSLVSS